MPHKIAKGRDKYLLVSFLLATVNSINGIMKSLQIVGLAKRIFCAFCHLATSYGRCYRRATPDSPDLARPHGPTESRRFD